MNRLNWLIEKSLVDRVRIEVDVENQLESALVNLSINPSPRLSARACAESFLIFYS